MYKNNNYQYVEQIAFVSGPDLDNKSSNRDSNMCRAHAL